MIGAEKVLVQKSGYYSRSAPANKKDQELIRECAVVAVASALNGISGLVGQDEDQGNIIRACEFNRVAGAKPFNTEQKWFEDLLDEFRDATLNGNDEEDEKVTGYTGGSQAHNNLQPYVTVYMWTRTA